MSNMRVLFHGSTAGWIHISGFKQNDYPYGELNSKASFMFLCTNKAGADYAASMAFQKVRGRNAYVDPPVEPYTRYGFVFRFAPYLYKVTFLNDIRILDFHKKSLSLDEMAKVICLMVNGRLMKCRINNKFLRCTISLLIGAHLFIKIIVFRSEWQPLLNESFNEKYGFVRFVPYFGFDIVRNIHGDNGYEEVWALPIASSHHAEIEHPEVLTVPK